VFLRPVSYDAPVPKKLDKDFSLKLRMLENLNTGKRPEKKLLSSYIYEDNESANSNTEE